LVAWRKTTRVKISDRCDGDPVFQGLEDRTKSMGGAPATAAPSIFLCAVFFSLSGVGSTPWRESKQVDISMQPDRAAMLDSAIQGEIGRVLVAGGVENP